MPLSALTASPAVGLVGSPTGLSVSGAPDGTQVRYYVRSRPAGSAVPIGRLAGPSITPDVPGTYGLAVRDVTVQTPTAAFDGDAAGAPTDDEASRPDIALAYPVAETIARDIEADRGVKVRLSLSTYGDRADETRPAACALSGADPAALADPVLAGIVDELRGELELSATLAPTVEWLDSLWLSLHRHTISSQADVHRAYDPVGTPTPVELSTSLGACRAQLTLIAASLDSHETQGAPYHAAVLPSPSAVTVGTTLAHACAFAASIDRRLVAHATGRAHAFVIGDPYEGVWREGPYDLASLCAFAQELGQRLAAHRDRQALGAFHSNVYGLPQSPFRSGMSLQDLYAGVGQLVDRFVDHVDDRTEAAHLIRRPVPALLKPSDPAGAARAAEQLCLAMQRHMLDAEAHNFLPALGSGSARVGTGAAARWPYTQRIAARLQTLAASASPPTPQGRNAAASLWRTLGGWT